MSSKRIGTCLLLVVIAGILVQNGCGTMPSFSSGTGSVRVLITDKPYPFDYIESAMITITQIRLRRAADSDDFMESAAEVNADPDAEDDADDADDGVWVEILNEVREFDLTELRNGRTDLLAQTAVPAGTYTEMRLIVTEGAVTLTDERVFALSVPSGAQSGIKLKYTFTANEDEETQLLLDVDLSRAFQAIPSGHIDDPATIEEFRFTPSIAMRLIDLLEAGGVEGTVRDVDQSPIASAAVTAFSQDDEEVTSTSTEPDGTFVLSGLPTGTYRVEFSAAGFVDQSVDDVEVVAGEVTTGVDAELSPEA